MKLMGWVNVTGVLVLFLGVVYGILQWDWIVTETVCRESGSTTLRNLGLVAGGFIAIWIAIWRGVVADRQATTSQEQAKISLEQARVSAHQVQTAALHVEVLQHSVLNERYQRGAEMLGSPVLSVRLGGIYALQRLAEDEPEHYHVQIMRLFCAFVRNPTKDKDIDYYDYEAEDKSVNFRTMIRKDVQAAMTAIGTRSDADVELEKKDKFELDLAGAHLVFASLAGANLAGANLTRAVWNYADLTDTDLTGADLSEAKVLTQGQLGRACADSANPPKLEGVFDPTYGVDIKWRGKPCGT